MRTYHTLFFFLLLASITGCKEAASSIHESSEKSESSNFVKQCLSTKECIERLHNEQILVSESEIKGEEPFQILVAIPNTSSINGKVEGVSMNMGYIPLQFSQIEKDIYLADAMVGVCSTDKMSWRIEVIGDNGHRVSKQFEVVN